MGGRKEMNDRIKKKRGYFKTYDLEKTVMMNVDISKRMIWKKQL
jgi:hypothetical protein